MQVLCVEVPVASGLLLQQLHQRGLYTAALIRYLLHLLQQLVPFSAGERRGRGGERGGEGSGEREGRGGEEREGRGGEGRGGEEEGRGGEGRGGEGRRGEGSGEKRKGEGRGGEERGREWGEEGRGFSK